MHPRAARLTAPVALAAALLPALAACGGSESAEVTAQEAFCAQYSQVQSSVDTLVGGFGSLRSLNEIQAQVDDVVTEAKALAEDAKDLAGEARADATSALDDFTATMADVDRNQPVAEVVADYGAAVSTLKADLKAITSDLGCS
jgi:ABC-type transporter Mla subunit MlaD